MPTLVFLFSELILIGVFDLFPWAIETFSESWCPETAPEKQMKFFSEARLVAENFGWGIYFFARSKAGKQEVDSADVVFIFLPLPTEINLIGVSLSSVFYPTVNICTFTVRGRGALFHINKKKQRDWREEFLLPVIGTSKVQETLRKCFFSTLYSPLSGLQEGLPVFIRQHKENNWDLWVNAALFANTLLSYVSSAIPGMSMSTLALKRWEEVLVLLTVYSRAVWLSNIASSSLMIFQDIWFDWCLHLAGSSISKFK